MFMSFCCRNGDFTQIQCDYTVILGHTMSQQEQSFWNSACCIRPQLLLIASFPVRDHTKQTSWAWQKYLGTGVNTHVTVVKSSSHFRRIADEGTSNWLNSVYNFNRIIKPVYFFSQFNIHPLTKNSVFTDQSYRSTSHPDNHHHLFSLSLHCDRRNRSTYTIHRERT